MASCTLRRAVRCAGLFTVPNLRSIYRRLLPYTCRARHRIRHILAISRRGKSWLVRSSSVHSHFQARCLFRALVCRCALGWLGFLVFRVGTLRRCGAGLFRCVRRLVVSPCSTSRSINQLLGLCWHLSVIWAGHLVTAQGTQCISLLTFRSNPLRPLASAGRCAIKRRAAPFTYNVGRHEIHPHKFRGSGNTLVCPPPCRALSPRNWWRGHRVASAFCPSV